MIGYDLLSSLPCHTTPAAPASNNKPLAYNFALLSGISCIAVMLGLAEANAQNVVIEGPTITVPGDYTSPWSIGGDLTIGDTGAGTLIIENGAIVSNTDGYIGFGSGSTGEVTVSGTGSTWTNNGRLYVGQQGNGILRITDGGIVTSTTGIVGGSVGSTGFAEVSGIGSQWHMSGTLDIADRELGTLRILNGGVVTSNKAYIGYTANSSGVLEVSGPGSQLNTSGTEFYIGNYGDGTLRITDGGVVTTAGYSSVGVLLSANGFRSTGLVEVDGAGSRFEVNGTYLAIGQYGDGKMRITNGGVVTSTVGVVSYYPDSTGSVEVSGPGSKWSVVNHLVVGWGGSATLGIRDGGAIRATDVYIGLEATSFGQIMIGGGMDSAGNLLAPAGPGTIEAGSVRFLNGSIVFNHTSSSYVFDATINNGLDNAAGSGTGLIGNGVIEVVAGRTILNAYHGGFTGTLVIRDGGILQLNHDMTHVTTQIMPGGILEGHGVVSDLVNTGIIAPGGSIGTLTVAGNYTGNGGALHIETILGGDNSPTDRLVITGDVSGTTPVIVSNLGGEGADTINGIRIIEVGGVSPGNAFTLRGDYVTTDGQQAVIGGAYAYTLRHNSEADPTDGNWYLISEMAYIDPDTGLPIIDPETGLPEEGLRYQPGVLLYEQYPQVLASLNTVPTLQQRVGNIYWSQNGAATTAAGSAPGTYGMWGRIEGTRTASDPARSTSYAHRDIDLWKLQTGFDFGLHQSADGALVGGVNISYGKALAEIASPYGRGKIDATGAGIGATLTWYGSGGFYVDGQAQVTWFDSDITSTTEGRKDVRGNNGHGYVLSAETGNRYQLGNGFFLTPQVQLVWSRVDFDSFTDPFGARVSLNDGDSLRGRFGVSLDHEASWVAKDGTKSRSHVYGIANLYNEFLDGTRVSVDSVRFATRDERLWAGIGIGGTYEWANGAYAFFGNANIAGSTENMSDSYAFGGTLGFRARW